MARLFNGSTQRLSIGNPTALQLTGNNITVSAWINPTDAAGTYVASSKFDVSANTGTWTLQDNFGAISFTVDTATGGVRSISQASTITSKKWSNIAGTYSFDGVSTSNLSCYVGAVQENTVSFNGGALVNTTVSVLIGADTNGAGLTDFFNGSLADVAVWNVLLTSLELSALAARVRPYKIRPKALVGWWAVDGISSPEPDWSGNGNNATLVNAPTLSFGPPFDPITPRWPQFSELPPVVQEPSGVSAIYRVRGARRWGHV